MILSTVEVNDALQKLMKFKPCVKSKKDDGFEKLILHFIGDSLILTTKSLMNICHCDIAVKDFNNSNDSKIFTTYVNADIFYDLIKSSLKSDTVNLNYNFETKVLKIQLSDRNGYVELNNMADKEDFKISELADVVENQMIIRQGLLKDMISKVKIAIPKDVKEKYPCVLFEIGNNELKMTAVNGYVVSHTVENYESKIDYTRLIISKKDIEFLYKILKNKGDLALIIYKDTIFIKLNNLCFTIEPLDVEFIEYRNYFLQTDCTTVVINRLILIKAIKTVKKGVLRLSFNKSLGCVYINLVGVENVFSCEIDCEIKGYDINIGVDVTRIMQILKVLSSDFIHIGLSGRLSPLSITNNALNVKDKYLIVPCVVD